MQHKAIFFDIDDSLYDSTRQSSYARSHAIEAMIDAGLDVDKQVIAETLAHVIRKHGSNYGLHYNVLLEALGRPADPHLIAAAVVAYHNVKLVYLQPFEETIPSLLTLRDRGYRLGIITNGLAVKQWEKLIRLGLQHFFHSVTISEEVGCEKPDAAIFDQACQQLGVTPEVSAFVGNDPRKDIAGANRAGMTSIRVLKGKYRDKTPANEDEIADFRITGLGDLIDLCDAGKLQ